MVLNDFEFQSKDNEEFFLKKRQFRLASPIDRIASFVVDMVFFIPIASFVIALIKKQFDFSYLSDSFFSLFTIAFMSWFSVIFLGTLISSLFISFKGGTPGMNLFRIQVCSVWTGESLCFNRALLRSFVWWIETTLFFGLPHLSVLSIFNRRPIHDRLSDSIVISRSRRTAFQPNSSEKLFVHLSVFLFLFFLLSVFNFSSSDFTDDKLVLIENNESELTDSFLCSEVDEYLNEDNENKLKLNRIYFALKLFITNTIDKSCLEKEVDEQIWQKEDTSEAYLAKAFLSDSVEKKREYIDQVCVGGLQTESCTLGKLYLLTQMNEWKQVSESVDEYQKVSGDLGRLYLVRLYYELGSYRKLLGLINKINGDHFINEYLSYYRYNSLWNVRRFHTANQVAQSIVGFLNEDDQGRFNLEVCRNGLSITCSYADSKFCRDSYGNVKESDAFETDFLFFGFVKYHECLGRGPNYFKQVKQYLTRNQEREDYISAVYLGDQNKLLKLAVEGKSLAFRRIAQLQLLKEIELQSSLLNAIETDWMNCFQRDFLWHEVGFELVKFKVLRFEYKQAIEVAEKLFEIQESHFELKKLMAISYYYVGEKKKAWSIAKNVGFISTSKANNRSIASLDQFSVVYQKLFNENKREQ